MAPLNRLELRDATRARLVIETNSGRQALDGLGGSAVFDARRCTCGVLVLAESRHRECPVCDRPIRTKGGV
ncbi:MAG: hypothetical protein ACRBN8_19805 [Nannocystales bacterium]